MAARQNNGNIRQYRKPFNINLGTFIFFLIFVYIIICVGIYLFRDQKVVAYRVQEGALSVDNIYTAIALLVLLRHRANIVRLAKGEESKISFKKK